MDREGGVRIIETHRQGDLAGVDISPAALLMFYPIQFVCAEASQSPQKAAGPMFLLLQSEAKILYCGLTSHLNGNDIILRQGDGWDVPRIASQPPLRDQQD